MPAEVPPDAMVIRFRPIQPEDVLRRAEVGMRYYGSYRLSVFAAVATPGEDEQSLRARLLKASELAGVSTETHKKYFVCARAGDLLDRGFQFVKDDDDDELDEHYSVDLGPSATIEDVTRFLEAFGPAEKR